MPSHMSQDTRRKIDHLLCTCLVRRNYNRLLCQPPNDRPLPSNVEPARQGLPRSNPKDTGIGVSCSYFLMIDLHNWRFNWSTCRIWTKTSMSAWDGMMGKPHRRTTFHTTLLQERWVLSFDLLDSKRESPKIRYNLQYCKYDSIIYTLLLMPFKTYNTTGPVLDPTSACNSQLLCTASLVLYPKTTGRS